LSAQVHRDAVAKVLALLPEAALLISADGTICIANERAGEMLGRPASELGGRPLSEFTAEDAQGLAGYLRMCARSPRFVPGALTLTVAGAAAACRSEAALFSPRSAERPALLLLRLVPKDAAVNRFIALNLRIAELGTEVARRQRAEAAAREQQELLRVTLASIGDAVIATDALGRVTFLNAVAERYTGWTQAQAEGKPLAEVFVIINEATRARIESPVAKVLREGVTVGLANHTVLIARDGSTRPVDDSGAPIRDAQGNVLGVVLVFRDITERRAQERERLEADRRKDEFLAMLAHELRNPLAVLGSGIQVLRRGGGAPAMEQAAGAVGEAMERQIGQLARLVDDLLDVSRINLGRIELRKAPARLARVLQQAAEAALPAIRARGMELRLTQPAEPLVVEADVARLSQVFGNLLSNAAKFGGRSGHIRVVSEAHRGQALVRVQDDGIGIAPEAIGSIFDLFVQADRSLARSEGGLGVGLAVARVITELHGGSIEARSAGLGRGSEFVVRLPLAASEPQAAAPQASVARLDPRRILIVDDNADAAYTLQALMEIAQHDVRVALDAEEALRLGEAFRPQVVLLDIGLPGMDGYEVARHLRRSAATSRALIIAVSGYGSEADRRRAREAGFDHHVTKPIVPGALESLMVSDN
jgi:PAS domain S-box-containing protein